MEIMDQIFAEMFSGFTSGDPKFIISQVAALITAVLAILCVQVNKPLHILYMQLAVNITTIASHLFNGAGAGSALIIVAVIHLSYNCYFTVKGKTPPRLSLWLFAIPYLGSAIIASPRLLALSYGDFGFWVDALLLIAAILFELAISSKKASNYRIFILFNTLIWIVYDYFGGDAPNLSMMVTHIVLLISNISAIIRIDIHGRRKEGGEEEAPTAEAEEPAKAPEI